MKIAAVVLAAGLSRRFGAADKLAAVIHGLPVAQHVARTVDRLPVDARIVVARVEGGSGWAGYEAVVNNRPAAGMGHSLALGIAAARRSGSDAALVVLADMPFVGADHFARLIDRYRGRTTLVASSDGKRRSPPALFGSDWFDTLEALSGDQGARELIARAELVLATASELADIDVPDDLAADRTQIA